MTATSGSGLVELTDSDRTRGPDPLVRAEGISSYYGDLQALFDVTVEVAEGETVAIVGANGAGKSTLLRAIAGLQPVGRGDIVFGGHSLADVRANDRVRLGISLVPEGRHVFPSLTVDENLQVGAYSRRAGRWDIAAVRGLFPVLGSLADRRAAVLSGGEQQALAIGRALMANPRLLLLDEVSLGLAPIVVRQLYAALPDIRDGGTTILLVEQTVDQALASADRVYCLLEGRVSLVGRPTELTRDRIRTAYFGV